MQLLARFDQRLRQPGESETRYSQRRLAMTLLLIAAFANFILIIHLFNIGLRGTAWSYFVLTAIFLLVFVLGYLFPARYASLHGFTMVAILVANVAANFYAGGYTSGFEFFIWVLTVPVWVALFSGRGTMILLGVLYVLSVLAAGFLEPLARANLIDINPTTATNQATFNFIFMGLPQPLPGHCQAVAAFAVDMIAAMANHTSWDGEPLHIRVGINCGPVVAGVIGRQKFIYDLWGDTVNVASRMESAGLSDEIQVTEAVKQRLEGLYEFIARGPIEVKGKGPMATYLLHPLA